MTLKEYEGINENADVIGMSNGISNTRVLTFVPQRDKEERIKKVIVTKNYFKCYAFGFG